MDNSVCKDQTTFNSAVYHALRYSENHAYKKVSTVMKVVVALVVVVLIVWAVALAWRVSGANDRTIHLLLALVFSPAYIIAHYLNSLSSR